jgi:hypothetical protein
LDSFYVHGGAGVTPDSGLFRYHFPEQHRAFQYILLLEVCIP